MFLWTQSPEKYSCVRFPTSKIIYRGGYKLFFFEYVFYDYSIGIQVQYKLIIAVNSLIVATENNPSFCKNQQNHSAVMHLQWTSMGLHR